MRQNGRIDRIRTPKGFLTAAAALALYFVFSEAALDIAALNKMDNENAYYISKTFSKEQREKAERFAKDLESAGERAVIVPGTILYKYKPIKTESFSINSLGFRGDEIQPKKPGEYRIAVFGDSKTIGFLLADEDTVPAQTEKELRRRMPDRNFTVLNFGIEAYDLQRASAAARLHYKEIDPDLIIFSLGGVDVNEAFYFGTMNWTPFEEGDPLPPIFRKDASTKVFGSKILNALKISVANSSYEMTGKIDDSDLPGSPVPPEKAAFLADFPAVFAGRAQAISGYFKARNIPTLILLSPLAQVKKHLSDIEKEILFRQDLSLPGINLFTRECYREMIKKVMSQHDFAAADHTAIFDDTDETVFFDGLHLTPDAAKTAAVKLSEEIIKIMETGDSVEKN